MDLKKPTGRPAKPIGEKKVQVSVYLSSAVISQLKDIDPNLSVAIKTLVDRSMNSSLVIDQAMLKGAMVMGMLFQQKKPGTFASHVYAQLSNAHQSPSADLLRLLKLLGESSA